MTDFLQARESMVLSQLQPSGITDEGMLDVFRATPREAFVPESSRACCYVDEILSPEEGGFFLPPLLFARLIKALDLKKSDRVLCVGAEGGYAAAIIAQLAEHVTDMSSAPASAELAEKGWESLGLENIGRAPGDPLMGCAAQAPYDAILVQGALADRPDTLCQQLRPGGRLVAVIVPAGARAGRAMLFRHLESSTISGQPLFDAAAPYLPGAQPARVFKFG